MDFLQKTNKKDLTWCIIVVSSQIFSFFVGFFGEVRKTKIAFEIIWPLLALQKFDLLPSDKTKATLATALINNWLVSHVHISSVVRFRWFRKMFLKMRNLSFLVVYFSVLVRAQVRMWKLKFKSWMDSIVNEVVVI